MNRDELRVEAARLIVGRVVADRIKEWTAQVREVTESHLEPGEKIKATLPDGTVVGNVQRTETPKSVRFNLALLAPWVEKNRPDEVVITKSVRESYIKALSDQCKKYGHAFDPETGEVIPGVELYDGTPSFRVTPSDDGRAYIETHFQTALELPGETSGETQ